ncbi:hypothetical protein QBC34DRAFT_145366 [Podospora aff. communis PSN243]|uniref:DUF1996 domain-containing protein n=1 Tax=Podospora aff. communis PSN243 TaxID=3040156 RepID=A0AAV9GEA7_9PEZI|nr:hypothetical protein QBC34DRAFT_145366 [Podospora aff. communis PSN243]
MHITSLAALALAAPATALLRFGCSQLTVVRVDPLVNPGASPSPHLHQIIGGNAFNVTMDPSIDIAKTATCTTCQFSEDFSNYWTAVLFFRARNGSYHRVPIIPNLGFEGSKGGMTVYYMQDGLANYAQTSKVTAFRPGFRQLVGEASYRTKEQARRFRQITYTCLDTMSTRYPETLHLPTRPCAAGIMANVRFPTCWDGKNLDSPDHMAHMAYPETGTFESGGPCPASHPVRVPQLMYETIWDTRMFNDKEMWPEDGSQPFVWSMNDRTGYGSHGDYIFGWLDDSLQKAMDTPCYVNCPTLKTQTIQKGNECSVDLDFKEPIDGWLDAIPGMPETAAS